MMAPPPPLFKAPPPKDKAPPPGNSGGEGPSGVSDDARMEHDAAAAGASGGADLSAAEVEERVRGAEDGRNASGAKEEGSEGATEEAHQHSDLAQQHRPPAPGGYVEPEWGGFAACDFSLEVLKGGAILETIDLSHRTHVTFGRQPT